MLRTYLYDWLGFAEAAGILQRGLLCLWHKVFVSRMNITENKENDFFLSMNTYHWYPSWGKIKFGLLHRLYFSNYALKLFFMSNRNQTIQLHTMHLWRSLRGSDARTHFIVFKIRQDFKGPLQVKVDVSFHHMFWENALIVAMSNILPGLRNRTSYIRV